MLSGTYPLMLPLLVSAQFMAVVQLDLGAWVAIC